MKQLRYMIVSPQVQSGDVAAKQKKLVMLWAKIALGLVLIEWLVAIINIVVSSDASNSVEQVGVNFVIVINILVYVLVALIPVCAIFGAKDNNPSLLYTSCVCSGICFFLTLYGIIATCIYFVGMSLPGYDENTSIGMDIVELFLGLGFLIVWGFSTYATNALHSTMQVSVVVVTSPVVRTMPVHVQSPVQASPQVVVPVATVATATEVKATYAN